MPIDTDELSIPVAGSPTPLDAYIAAPPGGGPIVIVGMELFGLHPHIRDLAERFAGAGYTAIAPNFYHRTLPRASLPFGDAGRRDGFTHLHQLTREHVLADVAAVLDHVATSDVAFVGFSVGGHLAYLAATRFPLRVAACFYPGWLGTTEIPVSRPTPTLAGTPDIRGRVLVLGGGRDPVVTRAQLDAIDAALAAAGVRHEVVVYPDARHGFFCDQRETFDRAARDDAWRRVLEAVAQA